jgi:hypothetical protein
VAKEAWSVDALLSDRWAEIGTLFAEAVSEVELRYWLDHRPALPDGRYRLRLDVMEKPAAEVDYRRDPGRGPSLARRHGHDRDDYVCSHCGTAWTSQERGVEWIYSYCSACGRFADGCVRGEKMAHAPAGRC